jgi:uncharacterized protein YigE (DUF2233 family)
MKTTRFVLLLLQSFLLCFCSSQESPKTEVLEVVQASKSYPFYQIEHGISWQFLAEGLALAEIPCSEKSILGNSSWTVIKINPVYFEWDIYSATAQKEAKHRTVEEWCKEKNLLFAVNAGMHDGRNSAGECDWYTNRGLLKTKTHTNNPVLNLNKWEKSVLAFNKKEDKLPEVKIIDLEFENWDEWGQKYTSYSQGLRLIDSRQKNRWKKDELKWSMVIVAVNRQNEVLFIFTRSPYTMFNHIENLLHSNLQIQNAMYLEGGPEASFYLQTPDTVFYGIGSYESNFYEYDDNKEFRGLANVIGIRKK